MGVYYGMNGLWVPIGGQGGTAPVDPNLLAENIKSGVTISGITGTFTNDATATASDIANGATAYVNGLKVTGTGAIETGPTIARATSRSIPNAYSITGTFDNSLPISSKNDIFGINIWTNDIVDDGYYDHVIAARYDNLNISIACLNRTTYKSTIFANLIDVTISENSLTIDFSPILSQVLSTSSEYYMYIIY